MERDPAKAVLKLAVRTQSRRIYARRRESSWLPRAGYRVALDVIKTMLATIKALPLLAAPSQ
jgi:hypothetical protein